MDYKELFIQAINSSSNDNLEELFENVKQVSDKLSNEIFLTKLRKISSLSDEEFKDFLISLHK